MMEWLCLLLVVFHFATGCTLSGEKLIEITAHTGDSALLSCACTDLQTKPQKVTWKKGENFTDVLNDDHYRGRVRLFNEGSPANLSLLISDLREEDEASYRCETEKQTRDFNLNVKEKKKIPSGSRLTPTTPAGTHISSFILTLALSILTLLLIVNLGVMAFICWRCAGEKNRHKVTTEKHLKTDTKHDNQDVSDTVTYATISRSNRAGPAHVQIKIEAQSEYAIVTTY